MYGDRFLITPLLLLLPSFSHTQFNVADLFIHYIEYFFIIQDPNFRRNPNLALGHLIANILKFKCNIHFPTTLDHRPSPITNHILYIFYSHRKILAHGVVQAINEVERVKGELLVPLKQPHSDLDAQHTYLELDVSAIRDSIMVLPRIYIQQLEEYRAQFQSQSQFKLSPPNEGPFRI